MVKNTLDSRLLWRNENKYCKSLNLEFVDKFESSALSFILKLIIIVWLVLKDIFMSILQTLKLSLVKFYVKLFFFVN